MPYPQLPQLSDTQHDQGQVQWGQRGAAAVGMLLHPSPPSPAPLSPPLTTPPPSPPPLHVHVHQVVREGSRRVLGLRPFDVQLIGGMILHEGQIAEMRTGQCQCQCVCVSVCVRESVCVHVAQRETGAKGAEEACDGSVAQCKWSGSIIVSSSSSRH